MKKIKSFIYSILLIALLITPLFIINNSNANSEVIISNISVHRTGCKCCDGTNSKATGRGACSHHGGVKYWKYSDGSRQYTGRCD